MNRSSLTFPKRVEIYNFIKTVGKVVDGYWEYNEGWNDERIANNYKVSKHNVATIRAEHGKIKVPTAHLVGPRIKNLEAMLASFETRLQENNHLRAMISDLTRNLHGLERKIDSLEALALSHGWRIKVHS
jgi:hypothetical protein